MREVSPVFCQKETYNKKGVHSCCSFPACSFLSVRELKPGSVHVTGLTTTKNPDRAGGELCTRPVARRPLRPVPFLEDIVPPKKRHFTIENVSCPKSRPVLNVATSNTTFTAPKPKVEPRGWAS